MSGWEKKRKIMRRYDVTATIYDRRYAEEQKAKIEAALEMLSLNEHGLVLDAGCGTGLLFDYVACRAEATVGLDISTKTLLQARLRSRGSANVYLVLGDADHMPFRDSVFTHAFAMTLIQNSPNPTETLTEMQRVAKDESVITITGLKRVFTKRDFERLLDNAGLRVITMKDEDDVKCYVAICAKLHHQNKAHSLPNYI